MFTTREIAQLRRLEILAAKVRQGEVRGERQSARRGPGSGFREHRSYSEGDALRTIDWHVYARMRALVVKEFDAEEALDVVLVQDRSASMEGAAFTTAAKAAAGIGAIALSQQERVLWMPAGGVAPRPPEIFTGRPRFRDLLAAAAGQAGGATDLLAAVQAGLPRRARGGVAFVFSDFFDPKGATRALSFLASRRYQVRAILIEDPVRLAPPPAGRARLRDAETGATLRVDVTPEIAAAYVRAREMRVQGLRAFCRHGGFGFLRARADQPFFEIVRAAVARGWLHTS